MTDEIKGGTQLALEELIPLFQEMNTTLKHISNFLSLKTSVAIQTSNMNEKQKASWFTALNQVSEIK